METQLANIQAENLRIANDAENLKKEIASLKETVSVSTFMPLSCKWQSVDIVSPSSFSRRTSDRLKDIFI